MATSPGRSAIQATPQAVAATEARKTMTRIIPASLLAGRARRFGGKLACGSKRCLPRLCLTDPLLRGRTHRGVKFVEVSKSVVNISARGFDFDSRQHRRGIIARRRIHRANTHKLLGVRLQAL